MSELTPLDVAGIQQFCKRLHMPTIAAQCARLAEQAIKDRQSHLIYLETLLEAELEERERNVMERRVKEARFPKVKTLEEFNFEAAPHLPATGLRKLAEGQYIEKTEPLVFIGDTGTGKTHLVSMAAKKRSILAGKKGPDLRLRSGVDQLIKGLGVIVSYFLVGSSPEPFVFGAR